MILLGAPRGIRPGTPRRPNKPPGPLTKDFSKDPVAFSLQVWHRILCGQPRWKVLGTAFPGHVLLFSFKFPIRVVRDLDANASLNDKTRWKLVDDLYAEYDQLCWKEFASLKRSVAKRFEEVGSENGYKIGWKYYQWFRHFYVQAGITDPPVYLNKLEDKSKFLGKTVHWPAHKEFVTKLAAAERYIEEMGPDVKEEIAEVLGFIGCFRPTTLTANKKSPERLSNHALGRAIDISARLNPHLKNPAIDEVLGWLEQRGLAGPERIKQSLVESGIKTEADAEAAAQNMAKLSKSLTSFLELWLDRWTRAKASNDSAEIEANKEVYGQLQKLVKALGGGGKARSYMKTGFISLPRGLYKAMKKAGLSSGLEYHKSKDTMHFEVLGMPSVKRGICA